MSETKNGYKKNSTLFADEKEAYALMLEDGFSSENALQVIRNRREKFIPNGKASKQELARLKQLAEEGFSMPEAVEKTFAEKREAEYKQLPWYKKVGKTLFDTTVGTLSAGTRAVGNTYDWAQSKITGEQSETGKQMEEIKHITTRTTGNSTASKVGEVIGESAIFYGGGKVLKGAGALASKLPGGAKAVDFVGKAKNLVPAGKGVGATFTRNAIYGAGYGGMTEIFKNGSDAKMEDIVYSASVGAGVGGVLGVGFEKAILPAGSKAIGYGKDLIKGNFKKVGVDLSDDITSLGNNLKNSIKNPLKNQDLASSISNKVNRFKKSDIEKFTKITGESPGEWAVNRGMTSVGDDAVEEAVKYYQASMKQADKGFESIVGSFRDDGDDYMGIMLGDLAERFEKTSASKEKLANIKNLFQKYQDEGLTMSEINQVKREYAKNFKYTWVDAGSESALRSTNIQNGVREWQFKLASENGFKNIAEINKNTQGWKAYADMLGSQVTGKQGNNAISLTDWVSLSGGNPANIGMFLGKQIGKIDKVQTGAMKLLSKQTKNPLVEAEVEKKILENMSSGKIGIARNGEKIIGNLNPMSGKQIISQDVLKIKNNLENVAKKYDVDLGAISYGKNEEANILKVLTKINQSIPKNTGKQTILSKELYEVKYKTINDLILKIKKGEINGKYRWGIDIKNGLKIPTIKIKFGNVEKKYHLREKIVKSIKENIKTLD